MTTWWTGKMVWALRRALRQNQRDFARLIDAGQRTVSAWERGESSVNAAAQLALDEVYARLDPVVLARFEVLAEEGDVNRRDFLKTAALAGATISVPSPTLTPESLGHLRTTAHSLMLLDDSLGSNAARPLIDTMAGTCTSLLRHCPELLKPQLSRLTAEVVASSAWSAWDQREVTLADELFKQAYTHSEDSGDTDIQAGILVHRVDLAVWTRRYAVAADYADAALDIAVRDPRMADYRALRSAQAFACANRRRDARAQLDTVSGLHTHQTTPDKSYAYWMASWVTSDITGAVLETTGDRRSAAHAVAESLPLIPADAERHRALTLLRLARIAAPIDLDQAVDAAQQAVALTRKNTSPRVLAKYAETRNLLTPWENTTAVRNLDTFTAHTTAR
ncbi:MULTISPECIES: DNA-binding transcriptional regulator [unclassified Nocardia]|uniref:helix-turn-helix domain-containing protein n=1 Tax=unclassified Nocardia TaxID=2637762 RepID=UPI001CE3FD0E|nr:MULTISPECIES: twin-arginine translocation signal domain-containing protein [unclassified Nocardia]